MATRGAKTDEEFVPLSQVSELILQQKETFLALLQQQSDTFRAFVRDIMDSTNSRLDTLSGELQDIKTSLQFTQKEVEDIKKGSVKQAERCNSTQNNLYKMCNTLLTVTDKMEYLEDQSRRKNLIIDGIAESPGEAWAEAEEKVRKVFTDKLQLHLEIEMERAHRTGKPGSGRPRPVAVKFLKYEDKLTILQHTKTLKGTKIFINA